MKSTPSVSIRVGCAGWSIPKSHAGLFPLDGTHLKRYAGLLAAVEINSSFYRPHRPVTYERWAASVPADFRFAVKIPKAVTHLRRLENADDALDRFLEEVRSLGSKLGPLLVQLPPSLAFSTPIAERFLGSVRRKHDGEVVLEPRHETWFEADAERLLKRFRVARAAADPAVVEAASTPGGWGGLTYYRLHGSSKMYYSPYTEEYIERLSVKLAKAAQASQVWCIFDNTAEGAAVVNAAEMLKRMQNRRHPASRNE